jgi:hypothetical protein
MRQGWEPLNKWLGKDVPDNEMPNGNVGLEAVPKIEKIQKD